MNASVKTPFLSENMLRKAAPAVFGDTRAEKLTDRYALASTIDVVRALETVGWYPTKAVQARARRNSDPSRTDTNRHFVRFRNEALKPVLNETFVELVLLNSHDGTSAFALSCGLFRLVCLNGMVVADSQFATRRYRHSPTQVADIIEGTFEVVRETDGIADNVKRYNGLMLNHEKRIEFANRAVAALNQWPVRDPASPIQIDVEALIQPQRKEDSRASLWNTFNIVQERVINGGMIGRNPATQRATRSRGISNPRANVFANQALWQVAADFYNEIKAA